MKNKKLNIKILKEEKGITCDDARSYVEQYSKADEKTKQEMQSETEFHYDALSKYRSCFGKKQISPSDNGVANKSDILVEKVLNEDSSPAHSMKGFNEYYEAWVLTIKQFIQNSGNVVINSDREGEIKSIESNNCIDDVLTHAGRATTLLGTYYILISLGNYMRGPGLNASIARSPFLMLGALKDFLKRQFPHNKQLSRMPDFSTTAKSVLDTNVKPNPGALDDLKNAKPSTNNKNRKFFSMDVTVDGLKSAGKAVTRAGLSGTTWLGFLALTGWAGLKAINSETFLGIPMLGEPEADDETRIYLTSILSYGAFADNVIKAGIFNNLYPGGGDELPLLPGAAFKQARGKPCNWIGPFLALMFIGFTRRKFIGEKMPLLKYGAASRGVRQKDFQAIFRQIGKSAGKGFDGVVRSFRDTIIKAQDDFIVAYQAQLSRVENLYPGLPDGMVEAYIKWVRDRSRLNTGADGITVSGDAIDDIFRDKIKESLVNIDASKIDDVIQQFEIFKVGFDDGFNSATTAAARSFTDDGLTAMDKMKSELTRVSKSAQDKLFRLLKTDSLDNPTVKKEIDNLSPEDVVQGSKAGATTDEVSEYFQNSRRILENSPEFNQAQKLLSDGPNLAMFDDVADGLGPTVSRIVKSTMDDTEIVEGLLSVVRQINKNPEAKEILINRVLKRYFGDEFVEDLAKLSKERKKFDDAVGDSMRMPKIPGSPNASSPLGIVQNSKQLMQADEATILWQHLLRKFVKEGDITPQQKEVLLNEMRTLLKDLGVKTEKSKAGKFVSDRVSSYFGQGARRAVSSSVGMLVVGGLAWGYFQRKKVVIGTGEDDYYFVGDDMISSGASAFFNTLNGKQVLQQIDSVQNKYLEDIAEYGRSLPRRQALKKLNSRVLGDLLLLPPGQKLEDIVLNDKFKGSGLSGKYKYWKDLVDNYGSFSESNVYKLLLDATKKDMNKIFKDKKASRDPKFWDGISSVTAQQPESYDAIIFRYGASAILKSELLRYIEFCKSKKTSRDERIKLLSDIFSPERAKEYSDDGNIVKREKIVSNISGKVNKDIDGRISEIQKTISEIRPDADDSSQQINNRLKIGFLGEQLRMLSEYKNSLSDSQREKINNLKRDIQNAKMPEQQKKYFFKMIDNILTTQEITKENKFVDNEFLKKLIRETLNESTGKGYNPYPYHSHIGEEGEESEDFAQDWKDFELSLVRDESRDTAIRVAKILVKDLELFGDVIDLVGKNQSVATEILKMLRKNEENS